MAKQRGFVQPAKNQLDDNNFEQGVILSGILKYGRDGYVECCDIINDNHFDGYMQKAIFGAYKNIFNNNLPFTLATVFQQLNIPESRFDEVKDTLSFDCEQQEIIRPFAQTLRKKSLIKDGISAHRECINQLGDFDGGESITEILGISEKVLFELIAKVVNAEDTNPIDLGSVAKSMVDDWASNPVQNIGLPMPWPKVNISIGGGLRTGVHLFAARLKVGKSSISVMTAAYIGQLGIPVLILDTEMQTKNIMPRMLANLSNVRIREIENGMFARDELKKKRVYSAVNALAGTKISHKSISGFKFDEVISTIRRWIYTDVGLRSDGTANPCLIIYDYFKVMDSAELKNAREDQVLGFNISKLVDFANKFDFPCLSFAQLNRDGITKEDSSAVGASDRLAQYANSLTIFKRKEEKEIEIDGPENGNRKMITTDSRYGGEAQGSEDHIHMEMAGEYCTLKEVHFVKKQDRKL